MASSQVQQISPFGCVLKNQNHLYQNLRVVVNSRRDQLRNGSDSDERNTAVKDSGNNNWDKVREIVFPGSKTEILPSLPEISAETPHSGGVSSLVRRWRDFEVEAKTANNSSPVCFSRRNSTASTLCDDSSVDGRLVPSSFGDGESDRSPPFRDKDSDASERERLRVADIIKKLTCNIGEENHSDESESPRVRTSADHQAEPSFRCYSPILSSPRIIRGRQAFADLLMQMECERHREIERLMERKFVSKFQHKGRIQAMLRLKFLRRGVDVRDDPPLNYKASESNRSMKSSIVHLRERFNAVLQIGVVDSKTTPKEVLDNSSESGKVSTTNNHQETIDSISHNREVVRSTLMVGNVSTSCQLKKDENPLEFEQNIPQQEVATPLSTQNSGSSVLGIQLEACPNSKEINSAVYEEVGWQRVNPEVSHNESVKSLEIARPLSNSDVSGNTEETKDNNCSSNGKDEETIDHQLMESEWGWLSEYSDTRSESCELQYDFKEQLEVSQDWISDVSRPQSEWEDLRQARHQEMLDSFSDNHDIQQLLQRRSVSNFLSGDMREKIDQLMISRSHGHQTTLNTNLQEIKEEETAANDRREGEYKEKEDVDNRDIYNDNDDDDEYDGQVQEQLNGPADSVDHNWNYNQDRDLSDESDHTKSAYLPQPHFSNFYSRVNQPYWSSQRHPSLDIQLIYDLKSQMEQLHQEIYEIQRSIKSCVNMQMKLQRSIKHEISAVLTQSGQKRGRGSGNKRPRKGNCCICRDMKVDSLLYRCGHICTCFNCARELQSGDGKCPICQSPILDIVRTHAY